MKFTLKRIMEIAPSVAKLLGAQTLSGKKTYQVAKSLKPVSNELKDIENTRKLIFTKYAEKDDEGKPKYEGPNAEMVVKDYGPINREWNELLETTVDLSVNKVQLKESEIPNALTPNDLILLDDFIEIIEAPEEEEKKNG